MISVKVVILTAVSCQKCKEQEKEKEKISTLRQVSDDAELCKIRSQKNRRLRVIFLHHRCGRFGNKSCESLE